MLQTPYSRSITSHSISDTRHFSPLSDYGLLIGDVILSGLVYLMLCKAVSALCLLKLFILFFIFEWNQH